MTRAFVHGHAALILRLARAVVRPGESIEAHDVAQEVIVALLRAGDRGAFDPTQLENAEAYLRVVVRNAAHRARKRRALLGRLAADGDIAAVAEQGARLDDEPLPTPEDLTAHGMDARRTLEHVKSKLAPRDALVFALLVEDGSSIPEVALALGMTSNSVYQARHRILVCAREASDGEEK